MSHAVIQDTVYSIITLVILYLDIQVPCRPWRKGKKIFSMKELKKRGEYRVDKLEKGPKIRHPNASVIPVPGKGTAIIIIENKRVVEAWEVTNWSRYDCEKKYLIQMHPERKEMIIKSLTKKRFGARGKKWTASQDLKRFLAVSYMSNIPEFSC